MSPEEQADFEYWLEKFATPEEKALPFEQQVECHVLWLVGESASSYDLENMRPEDFGVPQ